MSNTKLNWRDLQVKRKEPQMKKKKNKYPVFLETEIHSTRKRRTLNSSGRPCNNLKWVFALPRGTLIHCGVFGIKCLSRGGESIVEFYIFSTLHWEILRYGGVWQIFVRYLCNCGLEFWYWGNSKHVEFFVIGSAIFSMVVSNFSISLCSVTVFRIPLAALQSFFLHMRIPLPQDRLW